METASSSSSSRRGLQFADLDDQGTFDHAEKYATAEGCKNFMVEFGPNHARIAYNLEDTDIEERLGAKRDEGFPIRWIPRGKDPGALAAARKPNDVEKGLGRTEKATKNPSSSASPAFGNDNLDFFMMMKNTVNYSDIDLNPKGTVISIHDKPDCEAPESENAWRAAEIQNMRTNISTVLIQLSELGFKRFEDQPLSQASVRQSLQAMSHPREPGEDHTTPSDLAAEGTSNLFYYLFEDYVAAVPLRLCARKLVDITPKILHSATRKCKTKATDIIPVLHYLTKDLRELKHLFEGYRYLIGKIMRTSDKNSEPIPERHRLSRMNTTNFEGDETDYARVMYAHNRKVFLSESALNRFDRLADRLRWLMLNTIEGYLEEINALSNTYFNLTQQKDSSATARLTRSATLLAKLSVFFLPISFITSYFSIQIEDLYKWWNGNTYWYTFAVVATISFLSLFFFSRLLMFFSDVLDEWAEAISGWPRRLVAIVFRRRVAGDDEDDDD
ncbi:hypothetical protein PG991_002172 [Apiospora marii]|uniref:SPX domain-containing protein n=1 Tax=Apiospora marii TaxID=335849 RepID=A0ABR1SEN9_9PEZI